MIDIQWFFTILRNSCTALISCTISLCIYIGNFSRDASTNQSKNCTPLFSCVSLQVQVYEFASKIPIIFHKSWQESYSFPGLLYFIIHLLKRSSGGWHRELVFTSLSNSCMSLSCLSSSHSSCQVLSWFVNFPHLSHLTCHASIYVSSYEAVA